MVKFRQKFVFNIFFNFKRLSKIKFDKTRVSDARKVRSYHLKEKYFSNYKYIYTKLGQAYFQKNERAVPALEI